MATPEGPGERRVERPITVLVADDQARTRRGLRALLATFPDIRVVAEAADGSEAVRLTGDCHPDVVLMDARMPIMEGTEATRRIKQRWPEVAVLMLTMHAGAAREAQRAGADAFRLKDCPPERLIETIRAVFRGPGHAGSGSDPAASVSRHKERSRS